MDFLQTVISRKVTTSVGVILLVMFGLIGVGEIPIQLTPQVDQPIITVTTSWSGRSPQEVVNEITKEQEEFLKNVRGLKSMRSDSKQGESVVTLELYVGTDLDRARQEVSDALRRVPEYPADVDQPIITTAEGSAMNAIAWIIIDVEPESRDLFPEFDIASLQDALDREFKPHLERIDGVAQVNVFGGREREARVLVDARALANRDLNVVDLVAALRSQNRNVSAGTIDEGKREFRVRLLGQYEDVSSVLDTVITYRDGRPVYVRDVADAEVGLAKRRSFVRSLSAPCVAVNAMRNTDANVVDIMQEMRIRLDELREEVLPRLDPVVGPHLRLRQVYDETVYIDSSINLVLTNLVYGGVLAALVLLLFLRSFISTGVIALAIPISVIGTFLVMLALGRTLNVISLAGLAFAVGMVVDNAIVVLENIHRHRQAGLSSSRAAYVGAKEVWGAIVASTLTTAAVFVPILTVQEEAGQLFRDISIAIVASVLLSLTVSVTVIPAACAAWLPDGGSKKTRPSRFGALDRVAGRVTDTLTGLLGRAIRGMAGWTVRPAIIVTMTLVSIFGAMWLMPPLDYLPAGNQNLVFGGLVVPPGQSMDQLESIAERIETVVHPYSEASIEDPASVSSLVPIQRSFVFPPAYYEPVPVKNFFIAGFDGAVIVGATSQNPSVVLPLGSLLTNPMMAVPDSMGGARQTSIFGRGVGGGGTIDLEVSGTNLARVTTAAQAMQARAGQVFGFQAIRSEPGNFHLQQPEWRLSVNRRGRELGLTTETLGVKARSMFDGAFVGDFLLDGDTVDLVILPSGEQYRDRLSYKEELAAIPVSTPAGPVVPMDEVVDVVIEGAPQSIRRIEELPGVTLSIQPPTDQPLERVMRDIREQIVAPTREEGLLDASMRVRLSGTAAKLDEVRTALFGASDGESSPTVAGIDVAVLGRIGGALLLLGGVVVCARRVMARTREGAYAGAGALLMAVVLAGLLITGSAQPELLTARFIWALVVTYLLMCALFESFVLPFVIMFSVPLAVVGGFAGLAVVHAWTMADPTTQPQQFDVLTMIGFIILIGVVVNNAILIVHQTLNLLRADPSMDRSDAVVASVRSRVRPIFMSTMTSVGGMLPLVLVPGAGSEMYRGLGSVVIGGLLCSTVFTLVLVPLLLSLVLDMRPEVVSAAPSFEPAGEGDGAGGPGRALPA